MKPLSDCRVTIVGLGLMGGSLAGALRGQCAEVIGVARREETVVRALEDQLVDAGTCDVADVLPRTDVLVLATPVRTILGQIEALGPRLRDGCLVMDLGSTKQQIVETMARLPERVQPLGAHPMCGKEVSGIEAADPSLYRGCSFILTPLARTSAEGVERGRALVEAVGARPMVLDPARQDRLVATLSHLPYLLACALVLTADATTSKDPAAWEIVASGFRDTSRVAGSDVSMMTDILLTNRAAVGDAVRTFREMLDQLAAWIEQGDEDEMRRALSTCRNERRRMFP